MNERQLHRKKERGERHVALNVQRTIPYSFAHRFDRLLLLLRADHSPSHRLRDYRTPHVPIPRFFFPSV